MNDSASFAIVGGGIGGLTLAIAMQRKGFKVTVYEGAPLIKPLGAGLALAANAVKGFTEIGISEEVLRAGKIIKTFAIKDQEGNVLSETDSERISARHGVIDNFTIHRADLHQALMSQLKEGTVQLGKTCVDFYQNPTGVTLYFSDGSIAMADYAIASDGIHSLFRKRLIPGSEPRYAGYTCWRAVIDNVPPDFDFNETSETWGPGCRFGIVPLSGRRVYWFACINAEANDTGMRSFNIPELMSYFGDFHPVVPELLRLTRNDQLIWGDIMDLKPLDRFAFDNIVLMGDAAHATTPNMGQGACMAIEDAVVLANCIENYMTPREAFKRFEEKRIERTTRIVNTSRTMGRLAQLEHPWLVELRNALMRLTPPQVMEKQMKFLYEVSFQ